MIGPEQLSAALERLDPRDRELLALSLRRRVPDEALGRVYDCEPGEIARRRAGAIDRLADDLGVQRGEDLGSVLKALLEPGTWASVDSGRAGPITGAGSEFGLEVGRAAAKPAAPPEEADADEPPEHEPRVYRIGAAAAPDAPVAEAVPDPAAPATVAELTQPPVEVEPEVGAKAHSESGSAGVAAEAVAPAQEPDPADTEADVASPAEEPGSAGAEAEPAGLAQARPGVAASSAAAARELPPEPVLEMLSGARSARAERRSPRLMVLAGLGIAALAALAGFVGASQLGDDDGGSQSGDGGGVRHFVPQERGPLGAAPFPSDPETAACYPTAYVRRKTTLYREPGGRRLITIAARTDWDSPRVLGVASQREGWLAVTAPELANGELGWIQRSQARVDCVRWSLHADLSRRTLYVRKDGHTVRKLTVAIGSPAHPTPEGRFAVTDRLRVSDKSSPYGCCVLALSGHQTKLPDDWPGGDRLAVHATTDVQSIGKSVSLGCMRATSDQVRWLIETIPLGAPIFIRS